MPEERKKWISIMIVPEDGAGVRNWRVTTKQYFRLKVLAITACVVLVAGIVSMAGLGIMTWKVTQYRRYNAELLDAASKLNAIASRLDRYEEKEKKLRKIIGSDIQLPSAVSVDLDMSGTLDTAAAGGGGDEMDHLVESEEAKLRSKPSAWPVSNPWKISQKFINSGNRRRDHYGIDILAPANSTVLASADGRVIFAGTDEKLGKLIVIDHGANGYQTKYGHLQSFLVKEGDHASKGMTIGIYGGLEGKTTGSHLHFEIIADGKPVDPLAYLTPRPELQLAQR